MSFKVGRFEIGREHKPFIIAEMSGNHNGSLERALEIVQAAAKAGAHAIKLQTYTADTMTLNLSDGDFFIDDPSSPWAKRTLYDLYREAHTPWDWHKPIFDLARDLGLVAFSTPFDSTAVDFLEKLEVPLYKVASFESTDTQLIKKIAKTGKPMIISTGLSTAAEIEESVKCAQENGCKHLILLKCTSSYPASPNNSNLITIPHMQELFNVHIGLSDHTLGIGAAIASVALGAVVIEKHVTLKREEGGVDAGFSLEPDELRSLVEESARAWAAVGEVTYGPGEISSLQFRRSLYIVEDIEAGDIITHKNMRAIRPGAGLPVKFVDVFMGRRVSKTIRKGTPVSWDII